MRGEGGKSRPLRHAECQSDKPLSSCKLACGPMCPGFVTALSVMHVRPLGRQMIRLVADKLDVGVELEVGCGRGGSDVDGLCLSLDFPGRPARRTSPRPLQYSSFVPALRSYPRVLRPQPCLQTVAEDEWKSTTRRVATGFRNRSTTCSRSLWKRASNGSPCP